MEIKKITNEAGELLDFLETRKLKPDEKIATLKSAAAIIENVLAAESVTHMLAKMLTGQQH